MTRVQECPAYLGATTHQLSYHCFIVCSSSRLVPSYVHHVTERGVQSMGPIFIRRDLNIEHREIHRKRLPQRKRCYVRRNLKVDAGVDVNQILIRKRRRVPARRFSGHRHPPICNGLAVSTTGRDQGQFFNYADRIGRVVFFTSFQIPS